MKDKHFRDLGKISQNIVHDAKNPMMVISSYLFKIERMVKKDKLDPEELMVLTQKINDEIQKSSKIMTGIQTFMANSDDLKLELITFEEFQSFIAEKFPGKNIKVEQIEGGERINLNKEKCLEIFTELIKNSEEWKQEDLEIIIQMGGTKKKTLIHYFDNGPGIIDKNKNKIFNPLFTTHEDTDKHMGMGLATVNEILGEQGGYIYLEPVEKGLHFILGFPFLLDEE